MYSQYTVNPILKYIIIFVLTFMFLNSININKDKILIIIIFTLILNITSDVLIVDNYDELISNQNMIYDE